MADNKKYMARVPIIPDDFENKDEHKNHEIVMDFNENDIYVKEGDGYVSITGQIKEDIKKIQDGSVVVHIVTESTLPAIKDRKTNHWYYVITSSETSKSGAVGLENYVYYGLIDTTAKDRLYQYILVAQNMIEDSSTVKVTLREDYVIAFYVPINMTPTFVNEDTGAVIDADVEDRLYAINNINGSYVSYDVYILRLTDEGDYNITVDLAGSDYYNIHFDTNISVSGLVLPDDIKIRIGMALGELLPEEPDKTDARYIFNGWSTNKISPIIIDESYVPESNITLYAFYTYESDPSLLSYYSTYESTTGDDNSGSNNDGNDDYGA